MEEDQPQEQPAWREGPKESAEAARRRKLLSKVQVKYPKRCMQLKANLLDDLKRSFQSSGAAGHKDGISSTILSRITHRPLRTLPKRNFRNALVRLQAEMEPRVSELVTIINSSKFNIATNSKTDFNINRGISTMSCYDNIPREPAVTVEDGDSLESRPDLTQAFNNASIHCETQTNDIINQKALHMDLIDQAVSLDIGGSAQNQKGSQLSVFEPQSVVNVSGRFREYCTNLVNRQLNEKLEKFLMELSRLQRNLYKRDNLKGRFRRRYYAGFNETERRLQLKKIKFVIIAPDLDKNKDNGELEKLVHRFIDSCKKHEIAVMFGLSRRKLGYITHGKGFVSCIGVANYEAIEEKLEDALTKVLELKNEFKIRNGEPTKTVDIKKILADDLLLSERVKILLKTLAFS